MGVFVALSQCENLNESARRNSRRRRSLLAIVAAWKSRHSYIQTSSNVIVVMQLILAVETHIIRWQSCEYSRYMRFYIERCLYITRIRQNDEARRGLNAASGDAVRAWKRTRGYALARSFLHCVTMHFFRRFVTKRTRCLARRISSPARSRAVVSRGKWHLNPSIIPHVIPLPTKNWKGSVCRAGGTRHGGKRERIRGEGYRGNAWARESWYGRMMKQRKEKKIGSRDAICVKY